MTINGASTKHANVIMSSDSDEEMKQENTVDISYCRKYQMLQERCEILQQDNERLVHRIQRVYSYTRLIKKETEFLINRLKNYNDNWCEALHQHFIDSLNKESELTQMTGNHKSWKVSKNPSNRSSRNEQLHKKRCKEKKPSRSKNNITAELDF